jgi:DNA-binding response OmpR family regulator
MYHGNMNYYERRGTGLIDILIVEDDESISTLIKMSLRQLGYCCSCAFDGEEAANMLDEKSYDLILLDIMLPKADGFELLEYIRPMGTPVIFITAKNSVDDRVKGLRMGAEDYIVKPFEVIELQARVDVVLRRYNKTAKTIEIDGLSIDTESMQVSRGKAEIQLTPKEYDLLLLFARNPGKALYRETIYERVWGGELEYGSKTVDLHVQRLRKKVGWEKVLRAVNKVGYRLEIDNEI